MNKKRRLAVALLLLSLLFGCLSGCGGAVALAQKTDGTKAPLPADKNANYLKAYFGIALGEPVTEGAFVAAMERLQQPGQIFRLEAERPEAGLTGMAAVRYAVAGANMEELASIYTAEKVERVLAGIAGAEERGARYLACALDLGLISDGQARQFAAEETVSVAEADALLMASAECNGTARNFIGYTDEPDIYAKLMNRWNAAEFFDDPVLTQFGTEIVMGHICSGYGLTKACNDARFLPELTLRYGHSEIKHAVQILGLMQSEGLVARVQLEPKVSTYEYLSEWGKPSPATPTYRVEEINEGFYLVFTLEYDLALEFETQAERERFDKIVLQYAKKNSGEEEKTLLFDSWWQPVYESKTEMGGDYYKIYDHVVDNGDYVLHFRTNEDILSELKQAGGQLPIQRQEIWVGSPFYRYFLGEAE